MYYATYKDIGETDIAAFQTEQERDDWVNFKDEFSKIFGTDKDNCTFKRKKLSTKVAEQKIKNRLHKKDCFNIGQEWYILENHIY